MTVASILLAMAASVAASPAAPAARADAAPHRVTVQLESMPLAKALAVLARAASVRLECRGRVPDVQVELAFADVDFRQALRGVLSSQSHVLIEYPPRRGSDSGSLPRFELLFLSTAIGSGSTVSTSAVIAAPIDDYAAVDGVEALAARARHASAADERAAALDSLAYRAAADAPAFAVQVLEEALVDPAEAVRSQALATLKDTAERMPLHALERVVREDLSANVRRQALELLVERSADQSRAALESALQDSELSVRRRARELIEEWHVIL